MHVVHTALFHITGLLHQGVKSERIFDVIEPKKLNTMLAVSRRLYSRRKLMEDELTKGETWAVHREKTRAEEVLR